ncbi:MAG: hypothetical protein KDB22_28540 [Planctomycetales bacterium]|nr:hypothetical protein [Planctomycetales bacterium]
MRIALATVVSAIVMFFLGFLWWGLTMPSVTPAGVFSDESLVASMKQTLGESGVYFYPSYSEPIPDGEPVAIVYYLANAPEMGGTMGMGFAHMLVASLLACLVVSWLRLPTFADRFKLLAGLGLLIAFWADIGNMIWWHHPLGWALFHFGYDASSWAVAGAAIAAILKSPPTVAPASN